MSIEYLGLSKINGPLIVLEGVQDAFYDEVVEFVINGKDRRIGRIIEIYEDKAVIQVFEGTEGMSLKNTHTKLTGHPMEIALSPDILGRTFNGIGQPIDGLGTHFFPVKTGCKWSALKSGQTRVSAKLYPNRNFRHRRTDHPDPRPEASDFLRERSSSRPTGCPDRAPGFSGG